MEHGVVVGNAGLSSLKEMYIADYLKRENLARVNEVSQKVKVKNGFYVKYVKRLIDIFISLSALIVFSPVNLILGVCTLFDVGFPIFYKQTRCGKDGKSFQIVKFRNMTNEKDKDGHLLPAEKRVTKFGRFVRKFSLDELLNFWSVLKGDMSIIGPRPLPVLFAERYSERHRMRLAVKPGLECPRVILDDTVSKYHEQFENDIWYVEHVSFLTDCRMVFLLVKMTLDVKYRKKASTGGASYFVGYDEHNHATSMKKISEEHPEYIEEYRKQRTSSTSENKNTK